MPTVKESEKDLENRLVARIAAVGGWAVKWPSIFVKGLPDRICLFPGGRIAFAEVKTTGQKPTKKQGQIHRKLIALGFAVEVIDTTEKINKFIRAHATL
jgi:hypothetical protein